MKKITISIYLFAAAALFLTGCETFQQNNRQQDNDLRDLKASSQENMRAFEEQTNTMNKKINSLQDNYATVVEKLNSLQRQINYVHSQNKSLAQEIATLRKEAAADKQQNQQQMQKLINTVAEQTAKAVNSANRPPAQQSTSNGPVGTGEFYKYKVQAGATLIAIARAYKVSVEDIKKANRLTSNMIRVGQILYIPKKN
jgi:LysM repeat protein